MVVAVTDKEKGANGGVTCFLVDREHGLEVRGDPHHGRVGAPPHSCSTTSGCRRRTSWARVGRGFELAMQWIGRGRYMLPARASARANAWSRWGIEHARSRVTFGEPIANRQAIQWMIADSAPWRSRRCAGSCCTAAWQVDAAWTPVRPSRWPSSTAAWKANEIVDRVLQIHGGMGYTRELPVERWYRELRLLRIYEGTDEIQRRTIARNLIRAIQVSAVLSVRSGDT